jgi:hypothetical protein
MRNYLNNLPCGVVSCVSCLLFFLPSVAQATQPPVGAWDCVLSGQEKGVAHLFINADGTLSGRAIFTFSGKTTGSFTNSGGITFTNTFGGARLEGRWSYASPTVTSRILGFINGVSGLAGTTMLITNGLSFSGAARGSRLTLQAWGSPGRVLFRGIPLESTNDLSGAYFATIRKQGALSPIVETFDLSRPSESEKVKNIHISPLDCSTTNLTTISNYDSVTNSTVVTDYVTYVTYVTITQQVCFVTNITATTIFNEFPANYYAVAGGGPAYQYTGRLLVSRQNFAAFYQARGFDGEFITVYAGPFNPATGRGSLLGTDGVTRNIKCVISHGPTSGGP